MEDTSWWIQIIMFVNKDLTERYLGSGTTCEKLQNVGVTCQLVKYSGRRIHATGCINSKK